MQKWVEFSKTLPRYLFAFSLAIFFTWRAEIYVGFYSSVGILERLMCYVLALMLVFASLGYTASEADTQ